MHKEMGSVVAQANPFIVSVVGLQNTKFRRMKPIPFKGMGIFHCLLRLQEVTVNEKAAKVLILNSRLAYRG